MNPRKDANTHLLLLAEPPPTYTVKMAINDMTKERVCQTITLLQVWSSEAGRDP